MRAHGWRRFTNLRITKALPAILASAYLSEMANKHRGEKIFIFGDKGWRFRANLQAIAEFEGESGLRLSEIIEKIQNSILQDSVYLALEHTVRRNIKLEEPFSGRDISAFKKQIRELLLDIFFELNPKFSGGFNDDDDNSLDIPWADLMHIFAYHLKMPFEQFWNLSLFEAKILLQGLSGGIYAKISPMEIKEMKDIFKTA